MFEEWKTRWKAQCPQFFVKLKSFSIAVCGSALAVWTTNSALNLELDAVVLDVCKYTIAFSAAVGLTSQLTMKDPQKP